MTRKRRREKCNWRKIWRVYVYLHPRFPRGFQELQGFPPPITKQVQKSFLKISRSCGSSASFSLAWVPSWVSSRGKPGKRPWENVEKQKWWPEQQQAEHLNQLPTKYLENRQFETVSCFFFWIWFILLCMIRRKKTSFVASLTREISSNQGKNIKFWKCHTSVGRVFAYGCSAYQMNTRYINWPSRGFYKFLYLVIWETHFA